LAIYSIGHTPLLKGNIIPFLSQLIYNYFLKNTISFEIIIYFKRKINVILFKTMLVYQYLKGFTKWEFMIILSIYHRVLIGRAVSDIRHFCGRVKNDYRYCELPAGLLRRFAPRNDGLSASRGLSPTVNKLRARHPPEAVVNRKREGIMGKKPVLKQSGTYQGRRTMKTVQRNEHRISAGTVKCHSKN
jgi:hypothetical protein